MHGNNNGKGIQHGRARQAWAGTTAQSADQWRYPGHGRVCRVRPGVLTTAAGRLPRASAMQPHERAIMKTKGALVWHLNKPWSIDEM